MVFFLWLLHVCTPGGGVSKLVEYGSILVHLRFLAEANPTCSAKKLRSARITVVLQKLEICIGSTRVLTPSPPETGGKTLSRFKMF